MIRILYIDDEPGLLEIGKEFIELGGSISVETSCSASTGLDILMSGNFDAVVSDYQMPEMDGLQLLKLLRQRQNHIPFILFTARGREEVAIEALNNGADYYIQKGGDPRAQFADLVHRIKLAVGKRRTQETMRERRRLLLESQRLAHLGNFHVDLLNGLQHWSDELRRIFTVDPYGRIDWRMLSERIYPEDWLELKNIIGSALERRTPAEADFRILTTEGAMKYAHCKLEPRLNSSGEVVSISGIVQDVSILRDAEIALTLANTRLKVLDTVTRRDMVHLIEEADENFDRIEATISGQDAAVAGLRSCLSSIKGLMEFAHEYHNSVMMQPKWSLLEEVLRKVWPSSNPFDIELAVNLSGLEIYADPLIERAFVNLIDDSLRYGGNVSKITISQREIGNGLLLFYEDDGVGIPEDEKDRTFSLGHGNGLGSGLFLAKQILNLSQIKISETGDGASGVRFEMFVPQGSYRFPCGCV